MTLLERIDCLGTVAFNTEPKWQELRRALAIALAVDEAALFPKTTELDAIGHGMVRAIKDRADELLRGEK